MKKLLCSTPLLAVVASFALVNGGLAQTTPLLFDMGTKDSALWQGFEQVTESTIFSPDTSFGWEKKEGIKASSKEYLPVDSKEERDPVILTNPITEDVITGEQENRFLVKLPAGGYRVYVICGSTTARRYQYHDFDMTVGDDTQRVRIDDPNHFLPFEFAAHVEKDPLEIKFSPRNQFIVNAILIWPDDQDAKVRADILDPIAQSTWLLPPEEWEKWKETVTPPEEPPALPDADTKRGFAIYSRPYVENIYPHTAPRAEELTPELRAFATPGEYEPLNFAIYPLKDFDSVTVKVSDIGPIPAENVDIRHVRYMRARPNYTVKHQWKWVPDVLESKDTIPLTAKKSERFWLTVKVPENTPAGQYTGTITLSHSGKESVAIPVKFRVLPIQLQEDPDKIFGIYYRDPLDAVTGAPDDVSREFYRNKAELERADLVAHGTRNVVSGVWVPPADAEGNFNVSWTAMEEKVALWRKYNFVGPMVIHINASGVYAKYMNKEVPGSHLAGVKDPPPEFEKEITAMVKVIEAGRKERNFPEFLYYPVDEPSTHADSVAFMVKVLRGCKAAGVRTYVTADPTHEQFEPMRPFVDVWCTQPFSPDRETLLADSKARGVEYWCYPNHVSGENDHTPTSGGRMTYGFGFWRSGFKVLIPWIYSSSTGDPFNYLDGYTMDFFNRHEADGTPIPVTLWESFREGYDDYRYIYTLEQKIAVAKKSDKKEAIALAEKADATLKLIWDAIFVQTKYKYDDLWASSDYDVYRWMIAQEIMRLDEAMK